MREQAEPPAVVLANIALSPGAALSADGLAGKVREIAPGVEARQDGRIVSPIIIAAAVWRKMDVAHFGLPRVRFLVPGEALPQVIRLRDIAKHVPEDRLGPVTVGFEHFAHAAFVIKGHNHKAAVCACAFQRRRVAPESARPRHARLVKPCPGEADGPDLVDGAAVDFLNQAALGQHALIIHRVGLVKALPGADAAQIILGSILKSIFFDREGVDLDSFGDLVICITVRHLAEIIDQRRSQAVGVIPAERAGQLLPVDARIIDHQADAHGDRVGQARRAGGFCRRTAKHAPQP